MALEPETNLSSSDHGVARLYPLARLEPIFKSYFNLDLVLSMPDGLEDHVILRRDQGPSPIDFERYYQSVDTRQAWSRVQVLKAVTENQVIEAGYAGTHGLFVPIKASGKIKGVLYSGFYLKGLPDRADMELSWRNVTGRVSAPEDPHFLSYARSYLDTPWLEDRAVNGLKRLVKDAGALVLGDLASIDFVSRVEQVLNEDLIGHTPHLSWMRQAVFRFPSPLATWPAQIPRHWEEHELGLEKLPTAVLAVRTRPHARREDPLGEMIDQARLRRKAWKVSLAYPNMISGIAGAESALFAVALSNIGDHGRCWLETRDWVRRLRRDLEREGEGSLCFGAAWADPTRPDLSEVYDQALRGLMQGLSQGKDEVIAGQAESGSTVAVSSMGELASLGHRFVQACGDNRVAERDLLMDKYLQAVVSRAPGRLEVQRDHLLRTLYDLARVVEQRSLVDPVQTGFLQANLEREVAHGATQEMLHALFRNAVHNLVTLLSHPSRGDHLIRLEKARRAIDSNLQDSLRLEMVAREAGFSRAAFIRGFRQHTGLSFSAYLQKRRVERAGELLRNSSLSLHQISQECGFRSPSYFSQVFKRHTGQTPASFRNH